MNRMLISSLKRVFRYMKEKLPLVIIAMLMAVLGAVLTIVGPNQIGRMTDLMKEGLYGEMDLSAIGRIGLLLAGIYLASALFTFVMHYIMASVTLDTSRRMRRDLGEKINRVPMSCFNQLSQGDILSRITNDVQTLQTGLSNSMPSIISASAQFIGCLVMMLLTDWRLSLCVIAVTILGLAALALIMGRSQKYFLARQESLGKLNGYVEEMYSGHEVLRISCAGKQVTDRFDVLNQQVYNANWKSQFLSGILQPLMTVIGNIGYAVICVVGAILTMNGTITFGVIISFVLYVRLFTAPLTQIAQGMTNLQTASASASRVFDFLDREELSDESGKPQGTPAVRGAVTFDHVHFSYPDHPERTIINDFSAMIQPGQKVAIVGPTGAGKTTMVNLLMRFFEINRGAISIDGVPIADMRREDLHNLFSMVLQDTWLFEGTVRENLLYNLEGISDEQLEAVCKACGLSHFVHALPHGFDTELTESTTISAGQRQLLTIARAMLQNSPMLILDEATSSVDTRTEVLIQKAMDELTAGRTSFVIAHRLSTIRNADLILVMKDGDVIESGSHETLMAQGGFYCDLYNSQFEKEA